MDNLWMIAVLLIASLAGYALLFLALRRGSAKRADLAAFAKTQGWLLEDGTNGGVTQFRDPRDDWTLSVIFRGGGAHDGMTDRRVEWSTPQGALDEGAAVLGMPLPEKAVVMMQSGGAIGQQMLKAALKATLHALGKTRFNLDVDEATAGHPGGVVMASTGKAREMDALRENADLRAFRASHREAEVPVIIRDTDGLTLRRPGAVRKLDDLREIVALGKSLRADL